MSTFVRTSSDAVLIFARPLAAELSARRLDRRLAPLLRLPELSPNHGEFDVHLFATADLHVPGAVSHRQRGNTFGQRLENAVATLKQLGYQRIVILGRDCPQLTIDDVRDALAGLESHRLVIGPDQRGGCWLIGLHSNDCDILHDIPWQRDRDRDALIDRVGAGATQLLQKRIDVDNPADVDQLVRADRLIAELVRRFDPSATPLARDMPIPARWRVRMIRQLQTPPPSARSLVFCHA